MNQPQSPPTSGTVTRSVLPSRIRLLTERIPHVRTVAVGIWVGVGSRYEPVEQHGISHFLEHLFFKGTATRSALEIAQAVDDIGGQMNAFTDREQTVFYVKVLSSHLDRALEIYADMLLHSTLAAESIERERQVIAEEIKSYEDSPDELVQDLFAQTVWNSHPLGRPVIGTLPTVNRLTRDDFVEHIRRFYRPNNVVLAAAGDLEHDQVAALVGRHFGAWEGATDPVRQPAPQPQADIATRTKETEQVHLCLGTQGLAQADERRYALSVLDHLLGGGMSSRLFQEIRERRGLVYSISSYAASYRDGGLFVVYAGMSPDAGPTASWPPRCGRRLRVTWRRKPDGRQNSGCGRRRRRPHGKSRCASGRRGAGYDAGRSAGPRARGRAGRRYGGGHGSSWRHADRRAGRHPRREAGCPHRVLPRRGRGGTCPGGHSCRRPAGHRRHGHRPAGPGRPRGPVWREAGRCGRGAQLCGRGHLDDRVRPAGSPALPQRRDHRTPPRSQTRCAVGDSAADGGGGGGRAWLGARAGREGRGDDHGGARGQGRGHSRAQRQAARARRTSRSYLRRPGANP